MATALAASAGPSPVGRADEDQLRVERLEHQVVHPRRPDHPGLRLHPGDDEDVGPLAGLVAERDHALEERLVVAGGEERLRLGAGDRLGRREARPLLHEGDGAVGAAGGDGLDEGDARAEAVEGADEAEAGRGEADLTARRGDEEGLGHGRSSLWEVGLPAATP